MTTIRPHAIRTGDAFRLAPGGRTYHATDDARLYRSMDEQGDDDANSWVTVPATPVPVTFDYVGPHAVAFLVGQPAQVAA